MASTPFSVTPYNKRKQGAAGRGDLSFLSPVALASDTPFVKKADQRKEDTQPEPSSSKSGVVFAGGPPSTRFFSPLQRVNDTPASTSRFEQSKDVSIDSAFDEASMRAYSLDETCQSSAVYMNHLAIAFRSSSIIDFRLFKEDSSQISSLHPRLHPLRCSSPVIDFFFLSPPQQHQNHCRIIVASADRLSCHDFDSKAWSAAATVTPPQLSMSRDSVCEGPACAYPDGISRVLSCDGVCVGQACYIALVAVLHDSSCVIHVIQHVNSPQQWKLIQEIPISAASAVLRWMKSPSDFLVSQRKRLWFVCGDNSGLATLFECIFDPQDPTVISSISATDAYPLGSLPITSLNLSHSVAAIVTSGSCAVLKFDAEASTLRPFKAHPDALLPMDKGSKILAASVCPDNDCVAVLRYSGAVSQGQVSLEAYCCHSLGSSLLPSPFKYGFQLHNPHSFSGSAASLSWHCSSHGSVVAACTARALACFLFFTPVVLQVVTEYCEPWPQRRSTKRCLKTVE